MCGHSPSSSYAKRGVSSLSPFATSFALTLSLWSPAHAAHTAPGPFGQALVADQASAQVKPAAAFSKRPLTVECWAKLHSKSAYNIVIANESKKSATHWELFTMPKSGFLTAYIPGFRPNHARTQAGIVDGKWHYLAMVLEDRRARLYVDGEVKADIAVTPPTRKRIAGPLVIGSLVSGHLGCRGHVDEVRLSSCVRTIGAVPGKPFAPDTDTIALWHLDTLKDGELADASRSAHVARLKRGRTRITRGGLSGFPGGMSTKYQPLPEPEDAAPLRRLLAKLATELELRSVAVESVRDGVLRQWSHDLEWHGKTEYPEHRRGRLDWEAVKAQVLDRHALVWKGDAGPTATLLRRTKALISDLPNRAEIAPAIADFSKLTQAYDALPAATRPQHETAYYLAACAVRRGIALSNPLLDCDSILFVARGTFAGSVRSNPRTQDVQGGHFATQFFGFNALPGGGLYIVRNYRAKPEIVNVLAHSLVQNGRLKGRKLDYGAFATPDLSYDGKTVVFAWTENSEHKWVYSKKTCWHIFRVDVDGSNLVQLTDGAYDDFDPCWLPSGRIAFISERRGGYIRCFSAYLKVRNYTLCSMDSDGNDIRPLSYYETSEWNPSVNNDGRIVYTRWDYTDRENCLGTRIWICGPDGTDPRAPHGNYPHPYHTFPDHQPWRSLGAREMGSRRGTPLVEMGIRAVPDSPLYICTAAPHHGEVFGSLCMLDLRTEDDGHMSQVKRITPYEPFPESESPGRRHYQYGTPWPLSEDLYLCNDWGDLVLLDRYGNKELLCELRLLPCVQDERLRIIDPIPVRPRQKPPIAPPKTRNPGDADEQTPRATVAVMNVYDSDLPFPEGVKIKWLRITQNILKTNHAMGQPMIGYERENTPRIPLGIVPVEKDGSAYFEAPVAKELIFQVLDENYLAVQSMRSVAFVHPGEQLSCMGCHEPTHKSPAAYGTPLAMQRPPSQIQPEIGPVEPISFYRQIKPIFEQKCVKCHLAKKQGPPDMSYAALREGYTFWFSGAMAWNMCSKYSGVHGGSRTIPGRFGARHSHIGKALLTDAHQKAVSPEDRHKIIVWLDSNSLRLGAYIREAAQLRGELVWPTLDVDPANVLGVEGRGVPLKANFWHENTYGPHAFLGTSHSKRSIYIMSQTGRIVWSYPTPNPQDVWMLPNGNILTTHLRGVKEITRDKKVVWEYTVEPPNEVPTCQPLPNGRVMIGIVGECRLIEVDRAGDVVHQVQLATTEKKPHAQFRMCRKTREGTYLVPFTAEGSVREYDCDGRVIRTFPPKPTPVCALRLEDGHTLISAGKSVIEYDRDGRVVWELVEDDVPDISIAIPAGIQRLPNGNTIVCNWNAKPKGHKAGAHIFEVTHDKRVVWQVTTDDIGQVAQCQLLNPNLIPQPRHIVR